VTSRSITGVATGTVAWTYDTRFRPNREEVNGAFPVAVSFDHDGLPTDIGDLALVREPTTGRVSEAIVSYGVTTRFAYTAHGEVASANTKAGETPVLDLAFTYDVVGDVRRLARLAVASSLRREQVQQTVALDAASEVFSEREHVLAEWAGRSIGRVGEDDVARVANRKGRVARYRGVRKNLFDLRRAATIQNLEALFVIHELVA
jgi:hypothetical protein